MIDRNDLYGDGVNVAARLERLTEPGSICVSRSVYDQVKRKLKVGFDDLGLQSLKNIAEPVHVYRVRQEHDEPKREPFWLRAKPSIVVPPFTSEALVGRLTAPPARSRLKRLEAYDLCVRARALAERSPRAARKALLPCNESRPYRLNAWSGSPAIIRPTKAKTTPTKKRFHFQKSVGSENA